MRLIEALFEPVSPSQDYGRPDYILLALILAVGTWLRFWHLGNVGLHGDEDIMALVARGIVDQGIPVLPSGMLYPRAPLHTYLLAGTTLLFGDTEWALRLPSAVIGSLCGLLAFFVGRRFLDPKPNLAFVALITFMPAMIDVSLTARMYVIYVAGLLVFATLLFRWERTDRFMPFVLALLTCVVTMQFHQLAVFAAPLFLYPGLANRSWKQLGLGAIALVIAALSRNIFGGLMRQAFPEDTERLIVESEPLRTPLELVFQGNARLALVMALAVFLAVVLTCTFRMPRWKAMLPATLLLALGAAACVMLHYHVGGIALLFGVLAWLRVGAGSVWRLAIIGAIVGATTLAYFSLLHGTGEFPGWSIIGAFVGTPSVWPTLRFAAFSPVGASILVGTLGFAAFRLARGQRIPVPYLFFAMAVWAPLFAMGLFRWNVAERYTIGALPFFLLVLISSVIFMMRNTGWGARLRENSLATAAVAVVFIAAIINPAAAWQASKNDYSDHPDHKGAAEFVRNLNPGPDDIIIAEDSINQMYYLERVNYRLQNFVGAKNHSTLRNGTLYDQYTGLPVIGTGSEFEAILDSNVAGNIYVIGDGQVSDTLRRRNRGNGIAEVLASGRLELVYEGRDGATKVWRLSRRSPAS